MTTTRTQAATTAAGYHDFHNARPTRARRTPFRVACHARTAAVHYSGKQYIGTQQLDAHIGSTPTTLCEQAE